jgi:hypothetical protein
MAWRAARGMSIPAAPPPPSHAQANAIFAAPPRRSYKALAKNYKAVMQALGLSPSKLLLKCKG